MRVCVILLVFSVCFVLVQRALAAYGFENETLNLLQNYDFEERLRYANWFGVKCRRQRYRGDHYLGGRYSGKAYARTHPAGGIRQKVLSEIKGGTLKQNTYYYFSVFIKFLNSHPTPYTATLVAKTKIGLGPQCKRSADVVKYLLEINDLAEESLTFKNMALLPSDGSASSSWQHIGGDFKTTPQVFQFVEFYLMNIPVGVDYLLDKGSLIELARNPSWEAEADDRIRTLRRNTITLSGRLPFEWSPDREVEVKVSQKRHEFGFGSAVKASLMIEDSTFANNYREYFYRNFEWATLENRLKWKQVENRENIYNVNAALSAHERLKENGIKLRGHAILWNKAAAHPGWVRNLRGADMTAALRKRIRHSTRTFTGLEHWDVCNEQIKGHYYEDATGNPRILLETFERVRAALENTGQNVELFINEYRALQEDGLFNSAVGNLARYLLHHNRQVDGLGLQSHQKNPSIPMETIQQRLDVLSEQGLKLWISELSVHTYNVTERADFLRRVLKLYFSHPAVAGVGLWGFSDRAIFKDDCALTEGPELTNNAAGDVWEELVLEEWRTNEVFIPTARDFETSIPGFHGDYKLEVFYENELVSSQDFSLHKGADTRVEVIFP